YTGTSLPGVSADPECVAGWAAASEVLAGLGHDVEDIANPFPTEVAGIFDVMWASQSLLFPVPSPAEPLLRPVSRHWREGGRATSAEELVGALGRLQMIARRVVESFAPYDAILTPTLALPPQPSAWFAADGDVSVELERQVAFAPFAAT